MAYLIPKKKNFVEEQYWYNLTHCWENKGVYDFLEFIYP